MGHLRTCDRRPKCACYAVSRAPLRKVVRLVEWMVLLDCGHKKHEGDSGVRIGDRRRCRACALRPSLVDPSPPREVKP
jgi:hypothetical protein